ncbi:hypothetical protein KC316_g12661 [Hortaea werneckii]|nr:hypothetical protein KC324_g15689 [Hortaea werneckii]KAI7563938.1 hypothetical protein KC316_g12661 [Hortaea werneckii]
MSSPTSISAVESNNLSILFFNSDNLQITSLTAQQTGTRDDTDYNITDVTFPGGKRINVKAPQLSAVAYQKDNHHEIRIYYIGKDKDGDADYILKELCQTDGGDWYAGSLDRNALSVAHDSLLSANVEWGQGDLKVFYQRGPSKKPHVAWAVLGQTTWSSREIRDSWEN